MSEKRGIEVAYNTLFNRLVAGEYPVGTRLAEDQLAHEFRFSRTPVRDILRLLEQDGLVRREPHRGVRAVPLTADDVEELFDIRKALELVAIERAAVAVNLQTLRDLRTRVAALTGSTDVAQHVELDQAIHGCLTAACGRPRLIAVLAQQLRLMRHFRYMGFQDAAAIAQTTHEHIALLDALLARRADEAKAVLSGHLDAAKIRVLAHLCTRSIGSQST